MFVNTIEITPEYKKNVIHSLSSGSGTVTFEKADGTVRILNCTLDPSIITLQDNTFNIGDTDADKESIKVYDLDNSSWRSFRWDRVIDITLL